MENRKVVLDLAKPEELTLEQAIQYVKSYAQVTKFNYERLCRTFKYQIKGIDTAELLRLAGIK